MAHATTRDEGSRPSGEYAVRTLAATITLTLAVSAVALADPPGAEGVVVVAACDDDERAEQIYRSIRDELGETFVPREDLRYGDVPLSVRVGAGCDHDIASVEVLDTRTSMSLRREVSLVGTPLRLHARSISLVAAQLVRLAHIAASPPPDPSTPARTAPSEVEEPPEDAAMASRLPPKRANGPHTPLPPNPYFDHVPYPFTEESPEPPKHALLAAPSLRRPPPPPNPYFDHVPYPFTEESPDPAKHAMLTAAPVEPVVDSPYGAERDSSAASQDAANDEDLARVRNPYVYGNMRSR